MRLIYKRSFARAENTLRLHDFRSDVDLWLPTSLMIMSGRVVHSEIFGVYRERPRSNGAQRHITAKPIILLAFVLDSLLVIDSEDSARHRIQSTDYNSRRAFKDCLQKSIPEHI